MLIIDTIVRECEILGSALGFGAFEGGVIYFSLLSVIILKIVGAIKSTFDEKKKNKSKSDDLSFKIKVIK
ncbi:hypothetical protein [uncultured Clostridium sp.]|uniref:hypothetical protein n=1 Tax=uncultured Clostridium sp. TaxID=59620 RepID=UPI0026350E12|nr:hypothetical protein [uncultured Clostridium sp.]